MRALVLRHHEEDSAGFVGDAFAAYGAVVDTRLYPESGALPDPGILHEYDHVVILGSNASVYESEPWIAAEIEWLRQVPRPVLGICFGAQLLSATFGGSVERSPVYEVGWVTVDPVFSDDDGGAGAGGAPRGSAIDPGPWFQFHGDRCVLPAAARLLAQNSVGVQAFTIGHHLGVQFHPEVDAAQLQRWIDHGGRDALVGAGEDPEALVAETARREPDAKVRADKLVGFYLAHAGGAFD